jgi:hypothetical protein
MKFKGKERTKRPISSIVLYIMAGLVALIAIAFLVNNIYIFQENFTQYVDQGYPSAEVLKLLIPNQLLPGLFEPIAVYVGIAFLLWGVGLINQKVSNALKFLASEEAAAVEIYLTEGVEVEAVETQLDETSSEA